MLQLQSIPIPIPVLCSIQPLALPPESRAQGTGCNPSVVLVCSLQGPTGVLVPLSIHGWVNV